MTHAIVLGGGGLIGMGFHAGVLKALADDGIDFARADIVVATSAGAIVAAYLAAGWTPGDLYDYALGRHPSSPPTPEAVEAEIRALFTPLWTSPLDRARRTAGSAFAAASARGWWGPGRRGRTPRPSLRRAFPAGLYSIEDTRTRFERDLGTAWPRAGLHVCTAQLYSGTRLVFGRPAGPEPPAPLDGVEHVDGARFDAAVLASTSIPGVFPPVRVAGRLCADGGAVSATSVDIAVALGARTVLCIAPLDYRRGGSRRLDPVVAASKAVRIPFARRTAREVSAARGNGVAVLVMRPGTAELEVMGFNSMRHHDRARVVTTAETAAARLLGRRRGHPAVASLRSGFGRRSPLP